MRLFDGPHHANGVRFAFDEAFDAGHDRRSCGPVATARVGRDDEDFGTLRVHRAKLMQAASHTQTDSLRYTFTAIPAGCSSTLVSSSRAAFFISRSSFLIRTRCFGLKGSDG